MNITLKAERSNSKTQWFVRNQKHRLLHVVNSDFSKVVNKFATVNKKIPENITIELSIHPFEGMQGSLVRKIPFRYATYAQYSLEGGDSSVFMELCNAGLKGALKCTPRKIYFRVQKKK